MNGKGNQQPANEEKSSLGTGNVQQIDMHAVDGRH